MVKEMFIGNRLLREIEEVDRKSAAAQLAPRLGSVLYTDLQWAVKFIEDIDFHKVWEWFNLSRVKFYRQRCSISESRIDEIISEVSKLIALGKDIPNSADELPLAKNGGDRKSKAFNNQSYNVRLKSGFGNNEKYLLARLKRDHPDIRSAYERGDFKSVRAAAIEAGIVKVPSWSQRMDKLWSKGNTEEKIEFLDKVHSSKKMNNPFGLDELIEAFNNSSEEARDAFLYQETGIEVLHEKKSGYC